MNVLLHKVSALDAAGRLSNEGFTLWRILMKKDPASAEKNSFFHYGALFRSWQALIVWSPQPMRVQNPIHASAKHINFSKKETTSKLLRLHFIAKSCIFLSES